MASATLPPRHDGSVVVPRRHPWRWVGSVLVVVVERVMGLRKALR